MVLLFTLYTHLTSSILLDPICMLFNEMSPLTMHLDVKAMSNF